MNRRRAAVYMGVLAVMVGIWVADKILVRDAARQGSASVAASGVLAKSKEGIMSSVLALSNGQRIEFYGAVVDQHGKPVAGAKVRGAVAEEKVWMGRRFVDHYTVTDNGGKFAFKGLTGGELIVQPSKDGYVYRKIGERNFFYSLIYPYEQRIHPDPEIPEVFVMWKEEPAEKLVRGRDFYWLRGDGTLYAIDIVGGKKFEGRQMQGDLCVSATQPQIIPPRDRFDWAFSIDAIGGGLVEADETQYLYEAPADGYVERIAYSLKRSDHNWSDLAQKTFFVKSREGSQYALVTAEVFSNYQGGIAIAINYTVNPKRGSRYLESK
jgi:hypothetical protein